MTQLRPANRPLRHVLSAADQQHCRFHLKLTESACHLSSRWWVDGGHQVGESFKLAESILKLKTTGSSKVRLSEKACSITEWKSPEQCNEST